MLRNFRLREFQDFLKMAHAERPASQETDDTQPRRVAKALIDSNEFHENNMALRLYMSIQIYQIMVAGYARGRMELLPSNFLGIDLAVR